jgi:hypothetical protein
MSLSTRLDCYVCFEIDQQGCTLSNFCWNHICGQLYELQYLDEASAIYDPPIAETDPITGDDYSIEFDAALFIVKGVCICGNNWILPNLIPLPLSADVHEGSKIKVLGFMGTLSENSVPLVDISSLELTQLQAKMKTGVLTESYGTMIRRENLSCISAPTTVGFSGSPVLTQDRLGAWSVCGVFLGGPALAEHKKLLRLMVAYCRDKDEAQEIIREFASSSCRLLRSDSLLLSRSFLREKTFENCLKSMYSSAIYRSRQEGSRTIDVLNHNLYLSVQRISSFLLRYRIAIN